MMARSRRSNQRPDTVMQDRINQVDENLLHRTAGPYRWVKRRRTQFEHNESAYPLIADMGADIVEFRSVPITDIMPATGVTITRFGNLVLRLHTNGHPAETVVPASALPQRAIPLEIVSHQDNGLAGSARGVDIRRKAVSQPKRAAPVSHADAGRGFLAWLP